MYIQTIHFYYPKPKVGWVPVRNIPNNGVIKNSMAMNIQTIHFYYPKPKVGWVPVIFVLSIFQCGWLTCAFLSALDSSCAVFLWCSISAETRVTSALNSSRIWNKKQEENNQSINHNNKIDKNSIILNTSFLSQLQKITSLVTSLGSELLVWPVQQELN